MVVKDPMYDNGNVIKASKRLKSYVLERKDY